MVKTAALRRCSHRGRVEACGRRKRGHHPLGPGAQRGRGERGGRSIREGHRHRQSPWGGVSGGVCGGDVPCAHDEGRDGGLIQGDERCGSGATCHRRDATGPLLGAALDAPSCGGCERPSQGASTSCRRATRRRERTDSVSAGRTRHSACGAPAEMPQSRHHLFFRYPAWQPQSRWLWKAVGESGRGRELRR